MENKQTTEVEKKHLDITKPLLDVKKWALGKLRKTKTQFCTFCKQIQKINVVAKSKKLKIKIKTQKKVYRSMN